MQLQVLQNEAATDAWYGGGLRFTCAQCGNCCTGGPGYVWISRREIRRMAEHMGISTRKVISQYCRKVGDKYSLKETRNARGEFDCIFLKEAKVTSGKNGEKIVYTKRMCTVYEARPLQCRTWPFWEGNLVSPEAWRRASQRCHGMNNGTRIFTREQIETLRDAKDWPQSPPTSAPRKSKRRRS